MIRSVALVLGLVAAAGCQHATEPTVPAVLVDASDTTLETLKTQLRTALGKDDYKLGADDLTTESTITMMPPPLGPDETHSPVMPIRLELMLEGDSCYAVRSDTGEKIALDGISCRAV
ncbi:MAG: hypothetical protein AAFP81_09115 [Pseudomonadota bacterium]